MGVTSRSSASQGSQGSGGLTLLLGLGLFVGVAYALTRKEEKAKPEAKASPPVPAPSIPGLPSPPIVQAPLVQAPPIASKEQVVRATVPLQIPLPGLDRNLTVDEVDAVSYALARETNPANLLTFASSFFPRYPITAGLLLAKAKLLASAAAGSFSSTGPEAQRLRTAVEDGVRQPLDLLTLASVLMPGSPEVAEVLRAKAKLESLKQQQNPGSLGS